MNFPDIALSRLQSQQLINEKDTSPKELVAHMGAMQAQDYAMSKWAVGIRIPGITDKDIEASLDKGEILRTHVLRPTWHLVAAENIYWMLELSKKAVKALMGSNNKLLGITPEVYVKSNAIIEKAVGDDAHLLREEITDLLQAQGLPTDTIRLSHYLMTAELDGLICSGASGNGKRTYAYLPDRVKHKPFFTREEAIVKLACIYFTSHAPATVADFAWWSGLGLTEARKGVEEIKNDFISETINGQTYWFKDGINKLPAKPTIHLLPAFDEFLIAYKDRTASIILENQVKAFTKNGIFWPTISLNGQTIGSWKRTVKKDKVIIEAQYFDSKIQLKKEELESAAQPFGKFLDKESEIVINRK